MFYKYVICAGTFDKLHAGHEAYLQFAFSIAEKIYIALTSDIYTQQHKPSARSFVERKKEIEIFLSKNNFSNRSEIVAIDDMYGIAIDKNYSAEALITTEDTAHGAEKVNEKRKSLGLAPLAIVIAPLLANEVGLKLSSSDFRQGLTDENGTLLIKEDVLQTMFHMPETLRRELQEPFGSIYTDSTALNSEKLIAVGDVTTQKLHNLGYAPAICCIDFVVERAKQNTSLTSLGFTGREKVFTAQNAASTITPALWIAVEKALQEVERKEKSVIIVEGEEDLAVIPLLLLAPIGFVICYGQPHVGMVIVPVTEASKARIFKLLNAFSKYSTRGH